MNLVLTLCFILLMSVQGVWAKGVVDSIAVTPISSEDLQKIPSSNRNLDEIFKARPSLTDNHFIQEDASRAQLNLRNNFDVLSDPRRQPMGNLDKQIKEYLEHAPQNTKQIIDQLDAIKINPATLYKNEFSGFESYRSWNIHPQELPKTNDFLPQEQTWLKNNIPFGRIGISQQSGQWGFGLSTYNHDNWQWTGGMRLGESFGVNGPIVTLGKTPQGPGLSIYDPMGRFVGDVTKEKLQYDPYSTAKYLLRANYGRSFGSFQQYDQAYTHVSNIPGYGAIILPYGRGIGDNFQVADILNNRLNYYGDYKSYYDDDCDDDGYDEFGDECDDDDYYDDCVPPYSYERIYPRFILKNEPPNDPNDPLYHSSRTSQAKKATVHLVSGLLGGTSGFGSGLMQAGGIGDDDNPRGPNVQDQYSLPQIGFTSKSDPNSAWNAVDTKGPNVIVAVIDSGLDLTHPDGPEFIWQNSKEIPDNNIDDDADGYVDDVHGWNFLDENADLKDLKGHGTIVAGIIAAKTNNGQGIAGINPGAVIMPLKVADKNGAANSLSIYRAIHFAVDHGARIVNISLGAKGVSKLEKLAINYARAHNVLVVIASGNDGADISIFGPSSSGSAIAVGALNFNGTRSTVSNWGANNSLMAPGEEIFSLHSKDAPWDGPAGQKERLYTKESGTSFSAPMVAATASLLLVKNPNMTADQLEEVLMSNAKKIQDADWDGKTGAGLLDASRALRANLEGNFIIKITKLKTVYRSKKIDHMDVYATVRGDVDYFTVEIGKGKNAHSFKTVIGLASQQAQNDLVARIQGADLRGSNEWILLIRAADRSGKEYKAQTFLKLK